MDFAENIQNQSTVDTDTNSTGAPAPANVTITTPPEVFNVSSDEVGYFLTFYSTPRLFQLKVPEGENRTSYEFVADSSVIGLTISRDPKELSNLTEPVVIKLQSIRAIRGQVSVAITNLKAVTILYSFAELVQPDMCVMGFPWCWWYANK